MHVHLDEKVENLTSFPFFVCLFLFVSLGCLVVCVCVCLLRKYYR
jgi:hypothetical protein